LSATDEPFIQAIYDDILNQKDNDKGIKAEIKAKCVELLLSIEDSDLSKLLWSKIEGYITKKKKLLSLSGKFEISFNLPEKPDDFLNIEQMNGKFGFQKTSPQPDILTETEYWFYEILSFITIQKWVVLFQNSIASTIEFWSDLDGKLKNGKVIFRNAIVQSIARFKDAESANIYLKNYDDITSKCYYLLNQEAFESAILKHRNISQENNTKELLVSYSETKWSKNFAQKILEQLINGQYYYYNNSFIPPLFRFIPSQIVANAIHMNPNGEQAWQKQQWDNHVANPMQDWLEIRNSIDNLSSF
jgi:hypothetical protein